MSSNHKVVKPDQAPATAQPRKPYTAPQVTVIGTVEQLTQGASGKFADIKKIGSL